MAKILTKHPFGPWAIYKTLYRANGPTVLNVHLDRLSVTLNTPGVVTTLHTATSLVDAVTFADTYILNNYEVEKTDAEKLKDAEVEIAQLKARLEGLPKFKIGQPVTDKRGFWNYKSVTRRELQGTTWWYSRDTGPCCWREDELKAA